MNSKNIVAQSLARSCIILLLTASIAATSRAADPFAKAIVFSEILTGNSGNTQTNVANALGAPDGVYVSLGGPGASLVVDMGADTPVLNGPGPDVEVREIGSVFGGVDESYRLLVSNSPETNTFIFVAVGRALSLIDIQPSGLSSARYIWLQDLATETLNSATPGSDIDSLRALHYSGSGDEVEPPTDLAVRPTGQGAWLSWAPSTATNVTGYAIRRSLDGVSFGSSPDTTVTARETAWHDLNLPAGTSIYYAVNTLAGSRESALALASLSTLDISLLTNLVVHIGDDSVAEWEVPAAQRALEIVFALAGFAEGPQAELLLDLWDVDNSSTPVLLNGSRIGNLPAQPAESWMARSLRFPAGALQSGANKLVIGGATGTLDDFQLRNLALRLYGVQTGSGVITSARFTQIPLGQTTVTLRWVVQQTPTLAPPAWKTVSNPIEWTGGITSSNAFFQLQELP